MSLLFIEGFLAGLLISMPMGAIGILCLRYILTQGNSAGLAAGLGIASADALAACIGALGLKAITGFANSHDTWMHIVGSIILLAFGIYLILTKKTGTNKETEKGLLHIYFIMFTITFTNPLTLLSFTGIFASLGFDPVENSLIAPFLLTVGVFIGSISWWLLLILFTHFFNFGEKAVRLINEIAGGALIAMGLFSLAMLFF